MVDVGGPEALVHSGWLTKQGGKRKNWQRRYFEIRGLQMRYFKEPNDERPLGVIALAFPLDREGVHSRKVEEIQESAIGGRKFVFCIKGRHEESNLRTYVLQCESKDEMTKWIDVTSRVIYSQQGGGMFGESLRDQCIKEGKGPDVLPVIVSKCLKYLVEKGLNEPGIFRLPGRNSRIEELRTAFNQGDNPDISSEPDIHNIGSLFKRYLRDLPDCLVTSERFDAFISAGNVYENNVAEGLLVIKQFIRDLPIANAVLLKELCQFLSKVTERSDVNKMTSGNLAVVFAPSFFAPPASASPSALVESQSTSQLITRVLIENYETVFTMMPESDEEDWRPFKTKASIASMRAGESLEYDNDDADDSFRSDSESPRKPSLPNSSVMALVDQTIGSISSATSPQARSSDQSLLVSELQAELAKERRIRASLERRVVALSAEVEELREVKVDLEQELAAEQVLRMAAKSKPSPKPNMRSPNMRSPSAPVQQSQKPLNPFKNL